MSRRRFLAAAGGGAGALGLSAFLAACGQGAAADRAPRAADGVGSAAWWARQQFHQKVNFANWPYYIDVLNGRHPSLDHFASQTRTAVAYSQPISDNMPFYAKIRTSLAARTYTGYDIIVMTNNNPAFGYLMDFDWLTPLDQSLMANFYTYASPLVKNPPWDPGNKHTMAWQSGWTAIGYNSTVIKHPGTSVEILFDRRYAGKVGMMADPQELGSLGLLAVGVEPATSTESDWAKAARKLQQQKSDGLVRGYYDQNYINHLKSGEILVTQAWSGDIFQANTTTKFRNLKLLMPGEGAMLWTDNMCIPRYSRNPKDAMLLMDYFYQPEVAAVVEYYNDYICPVPAARDVLLHPAGWAAETLHRMEPHIGVPPTVTAAAHTVFPTAQDAKISKNYYQFKSQEELITWNNLFLPIITEGA
jgi:spermidine/putrescine transport system substrate-binding protein